MLREWIADHRVSVAVTLGALYVAWWACFYALMRAESDATERLQALRWQNSHLIDKLAAHVGAHGPPSGGAE